MPDIYETEQTPLAIQDFQKKSDGLAHGEEGHNGWRCGLCARESLNQVSANTHGVDYWQDKQLAWQEACDRVMAKFDEDVAEHFPNHQPQGCTNCPVREVLPIKPNPPFERVLGKVNTD